MNEENKKKFIDLDGLSHVFSKLSLMFNKKVDKVEGKGLSTNDLTDELKNKILSAGDSSFTGNYNDLTNKPDLTVYAVKTQVATDISNAVSDKVTETQMNTAINNATSNKVTESQVNTAITNALKNIQGISYSIVENLPTTGEAGIIYLISNSGTNPNAYDEYIWITDKFERIGTTEVDLTDYLKVTDIVAITNDEIDTIFAE